METSSKPEALPGAIGVTHLKVYDSVAADGLAGGSPHMHFACSEAYLVIKGRGSVQTLSRNGFREVPLRAGSLVWFTPGVIHRLINADAQLEIFAVMENAGLPEQGDSVLTFPAPYLRDDESYRQAASLDRADPSFNKLPEATRKRRDIAVEGFRLHLCRRGKRISRQFLPPSGTPGRLKRTSLARYLGSWTVENDAAHQNVPGTVASREK